jgi:hypothetical protein
MDGVRNGARLMAHNPGFTAVAIFSAADTPSGGTPRIDWPATFSSKCARMASQEHS